jgi:hypothetical protein
MAAQYQATTVGTFGDQNDLTYAAIANGMPRPDGVLMAEDRKTLTFTYVADPAPSAATLTSWRALMVTNPVPQSPQRIRDTIATRAEAALSTNDTYLAISAPTVAQNTAQTKALTKECSGLIRLLLGRLDSSANT